MEFEEGAQVRVTCNPTLKGNSQLIVVDYQDLGQKILPGEFIVFNYGKLELQVERVEDEENLLKKLEKTK